MTPPAAAIDADPDIDPAAERAQLHRDILAELLTIGLDTARTIQHLATAEATADEPAKPGARAQAAAHLADAYERTARAIRRTILLDRHLDQPVRSQAAIQTAAKRRVLREVEDAIHAADPAPAHKQRLETELQDRIDAPEFLDDIAHQPVETVIAEIRADLGLADQPFCRPRKRRTPADIATLAARAAAPPRPRNQDATTPTETQALQPWPPSELSPSRCRQTHPTPAQSYPLPLAEEGQGEDGSRATARRLTKTSKTLLASQPALMPEHRSGTDISP